MRICLYGGPGIGKSTTAAWLFAELKKKGHNIELCCEYIKQWCWEKRVPQSFDQVYIFAKQLRAEDLLTRRGVHIITDSPLPQQIVYAYRNGSSFYEELLSLAKKFELTQPAKHILLQRTVAYQAEGRYEDNREARKLDKRTEDMLKLFGQPYTTVDPQQKEILLDYVDTCLKEAIA